MYGFGMVNEVPRRGSAVGAAPPGACPRDPCICARRMGRSVRGAYHQSSGRPVASGIQALVISLGQVVQLDLLDRLTAPDIE
jgi:hypothetical protein